MSSHTICINNNKKAPLQIHLSFALNVHRSRNTFSLLIDLAGNITFVNWTHIFISNWLNDDIVYNICSTETWNTNVQQENGFEQVVEWNPVQNSL